MNQTEQTNYAILALFNIIPVLVLTKVYHLHPIVVNISLIVMCGGLLMLLLIYTKGNE